MKFPNAASRFLANKPLSLCLFLMLLGSWATAEANDKLVPFDTIEIHASRPDGVALARQVPDMSRLNGAFTIDKLGWLNLPVVGPVPAAGMDENELAEEIANRFQIGRGLRPALSIQRKQTSTADRPNVVPDSQVEPPLPWTSEWERAARQEADRLERDLTLARMEVERLKAEAAKSRQAAETALAETRQALEKERQNRELVERDLTAARRSVGDLQAKAAATGQTVARQTAAEQTAALKSRQLAEAALAETRQALEKERQNSELLERDLAAARRAVGDLQAKIEPAAAEQTAALQSRQAAEAALAETRQALEKERQNSELLKRDLTAARRSIGDLQAKIEPAAAEQTAALQSRQAAEAALAETRQALEKERQNSELLERDLAAARRAVGDLQAKAAAAEQTAAKQTAAEKSEAVLSRQAAEVALAQTTQALEKERQNSELLERDLTAARRSIGDLQAKVAATEQTAASKQRPKTAAAKSRQAAEAALAETSQALEKERQNSEAARTRSDCGAPLHRRLAGEGAAAEQTAAEQTAAARADRQPRRRWPRPVRRSKRSGKTANCSKAI